MHHSSADTNLSSFFCDASMLAASRLSGLSSEKLWELKRFLVWHAFMEEVQHGKCSKPRQDPQL
jgi:hypothetical protein